MRTAPGPHGASISPPDGARRPPSMRTPPSNLCGTQLRPRAFAAALTSRSSGSHAQDAPRSTPSGVEKHRPPSRGLASTRATDAPASWSLDAAVSPLIPPPIITASRRAGGLGGVTDAEAIAVHDTTATRRTADLVDEATVFRYLRTR